MNAQRRGLLAAGLAGRAGAWFWLWRLERSYGDDPYSLIEDGLYLGESVKKPPPGTQAVVNLCGREDVYRVDAYLWEPIGEGGKEPDLQWLKGVVEFIETHRRAGRSTYVHCMAGVNRSPMVVIAYLMQEHRWTREQALAFVRGKRPKIQPNTGLLKLLAEWEQSLKSSTGV